MESNPTRVCELIVGLGDVDVLGVVDEFDGPLAVHIGLRRGGVVEGFGAGEVGGSAGVRPPGGPGVAQAAPAVPGWGLCGWVVHRGCRGDRAGALGADGAGGPVGDGRGGPRRSGGV